MKKIFTFCVSLLAALSVFAYDFQSGDLFYNITSSSAPYTVEVTQQSQYYNSNYSGVDTIVIPETVTYNAIIYSVTSIGESAFDHSKLTTITIPNTVTSIGEYAFAYCQKLTSVAIGSGVKTIHMAAFNNCSALRTITIPANVKEIYNQAFTGASISTIYMEGTTPPSLLQSKSDGSAFMIFSTTPTCYVPCSAVASYNSSTKWKGAVREFVAEFPYTFTIASANTSLGTIAITQQPDCSTAAIFEAIPNTGCYFTQWSDGNTDNPRTLKVTQDTRLTASFASSTYVVNLIAGANGAVSGAGTYDHGTTATITAIPNDGYHFTQWSDGNTDNPRSIVVVEPISLTALFEENYTQEHCQIIYTSTDGDVVTPWVTYDFGADIVSNTYADGQGVITFDGPVTAIGDTAFANCSSLESIIIPDRVTVIGEQAFQYCTYLKDVTIGNRVESIGTAAFNNCSSLQSITIPQSVEYIYNYAFVGASLKSIYVNRTIPPTLNPEREDPYMVLGTGMVDVCYIPCGKLASYQISEWKTKGQVREFVERPSYLLTVQSVDKTMGTATITQDIDCETQIATIAATPYDGYRFVQWSDGNTDNPRSWVVTEDTYLEAIFEKSIDPTWQITYTSTDSNIVTPYATDVFGANIVSNTYENGVGTITFDGPVTSIGNSAFRDCFSLISITIPNSVTSIGDYAFYYCRVLTSITIPNSVTSIGERAFNNYSSLTSMTVENGNTVYDSRENCNAIIETATNTLIAGCQNTIIPNSVTSIGSFAFSTCSSLTSITIPNSVTSIGDYAFYYCRFLTSITLPNSVTSIGEHAFDNCDLTSVTIPNSVTSIGENAFGGCDLTSINVESGNAIYDSRENCNAIIETATNTLVAGCQNTTIPNSVTSIGNYAFWGRTDLTSITIPNSVTSIGFHTFGGCSSLTSITIPNSVTKIGACAFIYCHLLTSITIPNSVTSIGYGAFSHCSSLDTIHVEATTPPTLGIHIFEETPSPVCVIPCGTLAAYQSSAWASQVGSFVEDCVEGQQIYYTSTDGNIVIPNKTDVFGVNIVGNTYENGVGTITFDGPITSIGDHAFLRCDKLSSITIPNSVTSIGVRTFKDCISLTSISLSDSLKNIGTRAFWECSSLSSITIPKYVVNIGDDVFGDCSSLIQIIVEDGNERYDSRNDCNAIIETATNVLKTGCQNTIIPNDILTIGRYAFCGCHLLDAISIPNSVINIEQRAFIDCPNLLSLTIPNSVTTIGSYAFGDCSSLASITIPDGVTSIGDLAFYNCTSLTSITCEATTPPTLGSEVFPSELTTAYISCGTKEAYEASDWAQYVSEFIAEGCISFELNGGVVSTELPIYITSSYALPTPTREGYVFRGWYDNPQGIGNRLSTLPAGYEGTIYAYWTKEPTDALNPFAYALSSELSQDNSQLLINYSLNARAMDVQIVIMDGETAVKTIACDGLSKGSHSIAIPTAGLPEHKQLTWKVEVKGAEVTEPTEYAVNYSLYYPSAVDIDNNPENPTFGMILTNEGMHSIKDQDADRFKDYLSYNMGAGIYAFNPAFEPMPNGSNPGYNGGIEFTNGRADDTTRMAYSPRRIRISEDGRIFVTSLNTDGNYLWEVNPENMNEWNSIFKGTLNGDKELVDAGGNFIAAPNTGFDVKGSGEDLQLMMYSVNLPGITAAYMTGFRCDEYNLGTATEWTTAPSKNWVNGKYAIHYTGTQVEYDNEGGIWIASYRGTADDANPGLVHINKDGVEDAKLVWSMLRNAGIRFNHDFTKLVIAGVNGGSTSNPKKATIYAVSKDSNGAPVLTEEAVIDMTTIGSNLNDFAFDYAGNLYSCGSSSEKIVAWAMPRSADEVITTPAASKYSFVISGGNAGGNATPRAWAYDLALAQEAEAYTFTFKATTAANATLIFTDVEGTELAAVELGAVEAGLNTKTLAASELPQGKKVNWAVKMAGEAITDLVELTDASKGIYNFYLPQGVAVDNNPESATFGTIYVAAATDGASDGLSDRADTQKRGIFIYDQELNELNPTSNVGILPSNVTLGVTTRQAMKRLAINPLTNEVAFAHNAAPMAVWAVPAENVGGEAKNLIEGLGFASVNAICFTEDGTLYVLESNGYPAPGSLYKVVDGVVDTLFANYNRFGNGDNALVSDNRGGIWICQNRVELDTYNQLTHVNAAGEIDFEVNTTTPNGFGNMKTARGTIAYNPAEDILAMSIGTGSTIGASLYKVTYDEATGVPSLSFIAATPSFGRNVDGLAFDYAGDLYGLSANSERLYKFVIPTDNNVCTTPAASKYSFVISDGNNIITYTSTDGNIVTPHDTTGFGANIVSNIYENGVGTITFDGPITSIGDFAFECCSSLTTITIPESVTSIGGSAFANCSYLTSIIIPNGVKSIGGRAFAYCRPLTSITIPNSVTSIGNSALGGCDSLISIVVEEGNTIYDSRNNCNAIIETATNSLIAGCQNTIIPNSVTSIGSYAFHGCDGLTSITIPNSVTSIGKFAFDNCHSLTSVIIPNSVTSIGDYVFYYCSSLTSVTIGNSVTSIGSWAFNGCSSLTSITISNSVTSIGGRAFQYCSSLDTIHVEATTPPALEDSTVFRGAPAPVCVIPCGTLAAYEASDWANYMGEFVEEGCALIQMCGDDLYWEYADGVLTITGTGDMYDYAADTDVPWYDVRGNIKTVSLPDAMTKIGQNAFYKCTAMTSINMPTSLTAIGEKAFAQDTKLACEIILPASMTTIASRAFFNCQAVTAFHLEATTPPTIPNDAFERTTAPIHVPCGYGHIYGKHTQWGMLNLEMCEVLQDNVYYYPIDGHTARAVTYHSNPTDTIVIPSAVVIDGMPRTVTEVADFAFTDCKDIPAIIFNEGLEYIGERAFVRCYGLQGTIVLPATLETIGERAFSYCDNVEKYLIQAMTPPALGDGAFTCANHDALFYVSCEVMDDYKVAARWSSLKSRLRDACLNIYHYNTPLGTNGVYTTEDTLVASIYYRRQFTPYRWETLYLPFEVDRVTVLEDGVEYDLTAWDIVYGGHYFLAKPDGMLNKEILFGFTDELASHTPYIIQFSDAYYTDKLITFYGKESWNKLSTSFEVLSSSAWMQIAGNTTMQDQLLEKPVYMLRSGLDFILQKTTTTLHPFECYVMPYTAQSGAPARMNVRFRGDVPTAVESVKGNESHLTYTVDGYTLTVYPQGQAFSIYSLNGALIYSCEAGKEAVDCELNSGCYLLHAGTEAHKIML